MKDSVFPKVRKIRRKSSIYIGFLMKGELIFITLLSSSVQHEFHIQLSLVC